MGSVINEGRKFSEFLFDEGESWVNVEQEAHETGAS